MFERFDFDENGVKLLSEIGGKNADMLMTVKVKKMQPGEELKIYDESCETAVLILSGEAEIFWNGESGKMKRSCPFEKTPYCLHAPKCTEITLKSSAEGEFIIQQTENDIVFTPVFYTPETVLYQEFGKGQWNGAGHRICSTVFDYDNAPYSNMVLGEVFNQPGKWSSYPPHHHPQPEIYYYKFDKPQGFGACYIGDDVYKSVEGSAAFITDGNDHQQAVAPGYEMCYVWMVRHLDNDPWYKTSRFYADEHKWLVDAK